MTTPQDPTTEATPGAPTPAEVLAARTAAGQTTTEAAELIHISARAWRHYETGARAMHPAFWELYRLKLITR